MKIYIKEIKTCLECPSCHMDRNLTRFLCDKDGDNFICWMDEKPPIPKWCPLPEKDEFYKERNI